MQERQDSGSRSRELDHTQGSEASEEGSVVFRSWQHEGRHELRDQSHLEGQALMTHHNVDHLT